MRIAVFADVHGNLDALDAVLNDAAVQAVDRSVNLGDLLSGGLQPRETADRLLAQDMLTVRGNHERQLLELPAERMGASDRLAHDSVTREHREWLASLPLTLRVADRVLAFHGTPTDDLAYLLDTVDEKGARPASDGEIAARLGEHAYPGGWALLLCGHTHLPGVRQLPGGGPLVVNPGSVGYPAYADDWPFPHLMEAGSPHARYAIVDDSDGEWRAELRSVQYDWERAAAIAEGNARPDIARALRTGRA